MMRMRKNNLDEMQEQKLLKLESNGYWFAFWGLLLSMVVQCLIAGEDLELKTLAGEWIVFMAMALYIAVTCIKNGIWDRYLKPDKRDNLLSGGTAGLAVGIFTFAVSFRNYGHIAAAAVIGVFAAVATFIITFGVLMACAKIYKKKQQHMEEESGE